jgi:hypothetical protein
MYNPTLVLALAAGTNKVLDGVKLLAGKRAESTDRTNTFILKDNCVIKYLNGSHRLGRPVMIVGCPPKLVDPIAGLRQAGIHAEERSHERYMTSFAKRYTPEKGFLMADFYSTEAAHEPT